MSERTVPWRGVKWITPRVDGCPKHQKPVGSFTRLCIDCHREQIAAAREGSREWEAEPTTRGRR